MLVQRFGTKVLSRGLGWSEATYSQFPATGEENLATTSAASKRFSRASLSESPKMLFVFSVHVQLRDTFTEVLGF